MKKQKLILCRYDNNGFGNKNNTYYLLDKYGNKYDMLYIPYCGYKFEYKDLNCMCFNSESECIEFAKSVFNIVKW